ncbi:MULTISPECIES: hypothetical protein [unclassified Chryseobacterium]|uniref:hypothetical protein n=1 Tax=unclassified Chryseobacterium TaxID=2593645 RepID=UPI00100B5121|nr:MULTISPECIES: hypothetical protein [unclassified Chryseobacterium]RXM52877.1 hypothetical protein BOQ64_00135 [Chryseobacterium sp. CH25]RXM65930.1 hypothetical protein BOQ60_09380 [Chryseobacterium sp. CH1]
MNTNEFLKTTKKKSDDFVFRIIVPLLGLLVVIFNPISLFIISVLASILVYITVFRTTIFSKTFLYFLAVIYAVIMFVYSVSPKIQYTEFKTTHPNWIETEGTSLTADVNWRGGKNRRSVADITYQYRMNNKTFKKTANNALKNNTYSVFWNSEKEKNESNQDLKKRVENYVQQKNFKILRNPNSGETKLFIPLNDLLLSNSFGFQLLVTFSKVMLVPFFCMLFLFFWKDKGFNGFKK